jgi:hypothetical protein
MSTKTIKFDQRMEDTIAKLQKQFGATSQAEIIRKAIAMLEIVSDAEKSGGEIIIRHNDKDKHVILR